MQVLSHRGCWRDFSAESNKKVSFERSFDMGFGTETDLRDICGKIVISHDMPSGDEMTFEEMLGIMGGRNLPLALNIKADGMADEILRILEKYDHTNYFTFDMSIPDMVFQMEKGLNVFTGMSDILPAPVLPENACGVWLDSFRSDWFTEGDIAELLEAGKQVCIVSADLHGHDTEAQWKKIRRFPFMESKDLLLCTNEPQRAARFFGEIQ